MVKKCKNCGTYTDSSFCSIKCSLDYMHFAGAPITQTKTIQPGTLPQAAQNVAPKIEGTKHDAGKPNMALLPAEALEQIAAVLTFGATKYTAHNWRGGFEYTRVLAAALRHIFAYLRGEDKDPESGLNHLAHAACCLCFILTFIITKTGTDDRYRPPVDKD